MAYTVDECIICKSKSSLIRSPASLAPFLLVRMFNNESLPCDLLHCTQCNIYFSQVRPEEDELRSYYSTYHAGDYATQRKQMESYYTDELIASFTPHAIERKKLLEHYLHEYINPQEIATILDYGGGDGLMISDIYSHAEKFVYEVQSTDVREGIRRISNKEELQQHTWNLIICCHVLEHISNPMETISLLISLLSEEGYLYVEVPLEQPYKSHSCSSMKQLLSKIRYIHSVPPPLIH